MLKIILKPLKHIKQTKGKNKNYKQKLTYLFDEYYNILLQ